ncbi:hypothetical protein [Okeania hirsuta]|uniref:hypothetical protein n=1 Tax=Okeania hirsuta TaxID=1458930 RepID=UPI001960F495|nr:hypothetical protein [Okeania hirsuta]
MSIIAVYFAANVNPNESGGFFGEEDSEIHISLPFVLGLVHGAIVAQYDCRLGRI